MPDCLLVIEADGTTLMNANDTKIMGGPLRKILNTHRKIDFVFRSHSSANSRVCYEIIDRGGLHRDDEHGKTPMLRYVRVSTGNTHAEGGTLGG